MALHLGGEHLAGEGRGQRGGIVQARQVARGEAVLVRQRDVAAFLAFASNAEYLAGLGHRTAALEDSRLLPLSEEST